MLLIWANSSISYVVICKAYVWEVAGDHLSCQILQLDMPLTFLVKCKTFAVFSLILCHCKEWLQFPSWKYKWDPGTRSISLVAKHDPLILSVRVPIPFLVLKAYMRLNSPDRSTCPQFKLSFELKITSIHLPCSNGSNGLLIAKWFPALPCLW